MAWLNIAGSSRKGLSKSDFSLFTDGRTSGRQGPTPGSTAGWDQAPRCPLCPAQGSLQHSQDFFQGWAEHEASSEGLGSLVIDLTGRQAREGEGVRWRCWSQGHLQSAGQPLGQGRHFQRVPLLPQAPLVPGASITSSKAFPGVRLCPRRAAPSPNPSCPGRQRWLLTLYA